MISQLKENIDLAQLVESSGINLDKQGFGLCPFHSEKTASFKVYPDNHFKCFGCSAHGDVIDFVQKMYGLSFKDSLKHLGIEQGRITPEMQRRIVQRKRKG